MDKGRTTTVIVNKQSKQVPVDDLKPHPSNPRKGNVDAIADSIKVNGFYGAIVAQESTGYILVGNHRWQAAKKVGLKKVPVIFVDVDDKQARKILLADNKTADISMYDDSALAALLSDLTGELEGTGWSNDELDDLLRKVAIHDDDTGQPERKGLGNPVIQYAIIFDTEAQQQKFYAFLRWLKTQYPSAETNAERLAEFIDAQDIPA